MKIDYFMNYKRIQVVIVYPFIVHKIINFYLPIRALLCVIGSKGLIFKIRYEYKSYAILFYQK